MGSLETSPSIHSFSAMQHLLVLLSVLAAVHGAKYSPCSDSSDAAQLVHTVTCEAPMTKEEVLGVFAQYPVIDDIRQLTIRDIAMDDDWADQILNRVAASQETMILLYLDRLNLTRIPTTARMVQSLQFLSLVNNPLQYLAVGDLDFRSDLLVLGLQNTSLTTIQAGAFERANFNDTDIGLQANRLRALPVNTFQPLLRSMADNNGVIELGGNEIGCDCSVAWLFQEPNLLNAVRQGVCNGGLPFDQIPPSIFDNCSRD